MKGFSKKGTKRETPHVSFEAGKIIDEPFQTKSFE